MSDPLPPLGRRHVLGAAASLPVIGGTKRLSALSEKIVPPPDQPAKPPTAFPHGVTILVAGPTDGKLHQWAKLLAEPIGRSLPPDTPLGVNSVGGVDGVTGANQFGARVAPDGATVLLTPGAAALAWLVGDPRARFDVARWVPVMAAMTPGVVVARAGSIPPGPTDPPAPPGKAGQPRMAVAAYEGPDLAGLLALDLLGVHVRPVLKLQPWQVQAAFAAGDIDLALLSGEHVTDRVQKLKTAGVAPLFTLGTVAPTGRPQRDPDFPALPDFVEFYTQRRGAAPSGPLFHAWRASAGAARLVLGVMLPQLTPSSMVALWRRIGIDTARTQSVQDAADGRGIRFLTGPTAIAEAARMAVDAAALQALRQWMSHSLNWRAS